MAKYKDIEPIIDFIEKGLNNPDKTKAFGYDAIEILTEIEYAPTADVTEVRHERWKEMAEYEHGGIKKLFFVCPLCGRIEYQKEPYCHCGAKMDKGEKENDGNI